MVKPYESINRSAYNQNADYYSSLYNMMELGNDFMNLLNAFAHLSRGKILDLGSGNGELSKLLSQYGHLDMICLDNSIKMLKIGCCKKPIIASFEEIPFRDNSIDGILANCSLLHLPHAEFPAALEESKRVLKPYGSFLMTMKTGENKEGLFEDNSIERFQAFYDEKTLFSIVSDFFNIHRGLRFKVKKQNFYSMLCTSKP